MDLLFMLLLLGGCGALGALALRKRRNGATAADLETLEAEERGLDNPHLEDVVRSDGQDLLITGICCFVASSSTWVECVLEETPRRWLITSPTEPDYVTIGRQIDDLLLGDRPSEAVEHAGQIYQLERQGLAQVVSHGGSPAELPQGSCRYWNYARAGNDRLWIRSSGGKSFTCVGQRVRRTLIDFLPGS